MAATAAVVLTAAAAPALATTSSSAAHGDATSSLRLLHIELGGHAVSAGEIAATASNAASPHVAKIVVTPAALDGTTYGQQTVTPASSPVTVPSTNQTATIPGGLASLTGPTFQVTATDTAAEVLTSAVLKALGTVTVATLPLNLSAASLSDVSSVTATEATAMKSVSVGHLSLPSITTLLSALNINPQALVSALSQQALNTLNTLVSAVPLTALNSAVDSAQAAIGAGAPNTSDAATALKNADQAAAASADSADTAANSAFSSIVAGIPTGTLTAAGVNTGLTPSQYEALNSTSKSILDAAAPTLAQAATDALNADSAKAAADDAAAKAVALANAFVALAMGVLANVAGNTTPLVSLADVSVVTKAIASANSPAPVASATAGPLQVLGVSTTLSGLTSKLSTVMSTLSGVLNSVAGVSFTAPSIEVGVGTTSRTISGATHNATAAITALTVNLPKLTLPTSLMAVVPANIGNAVTGLVTGGGSVAVGTLAEKASYTPAIGAGSPSSGKGPGLASTGSTYTLPTLAAILIGCALIAVRQRRRFAEARD